MAQHVRQFYDIGAFAVKNAREQVPQVVREHLPRRDVRRPAGRLHLCPYLFSPQAPAASGEEYLAGGGFVFSRVVQELAPQPGRYQYGAYLALEGDLGLSLPGRLDGDIAQLADADAGGADCLHHQREPPAALAARRLYEPLILPARQLAAPVAERAPLYAQQLRAAVPAGELEEAVQRDQHTVDARRAIALLEQPAAPSRRRFARRLAALQPAREGAHMAKVVLRRPLRASRRPQLGGKILKQLFRNVSVVHCIASAVCDEQILYLICELGYIHRSAPPPGGLAGRAVKK